jgi:hypothetical protein
MKDALEVLQEFLNFYRCFRSSTGVLAVLQVFQKFYRSFRSSTAASKVLKTLPNNFVATLQSPIKLNPNP